MSSGAYLELLNAWLTSTHVDDHTPELPDMVAAAVTTALANLERPAARNVLGHVITFRSDDIPDHLRRTLRSSSADEVRRQAWDMLARDASLDEWETAVAEETDPEVRAAMRTRAPWTDLSQQAVWTLLESKSQRMTRTAARLLVDTTFRPGMEDLWRQAIVQLPAGKVPVTAKNAAAHPVRWGDVTDLHPESDPFYLLAQACAPTAPDGSLAALYKRFPKILGWLRDDASTVLQLLESVMRVNANRNTDVGVAIELYSTLSVKTPRFLQQANLIQDLHVELQIEHIASLTNNSDGRQVSDLALNWDRLPDAHRTDRVCTQLLRAGYTDQVLCTEIVDHLGDRAHDVTEAAGLLEISAWKTITPDWWRLVDRQRWVHAYRSGKHHVTQDNRLGHVSNDELQALADDLVAHPNDWVVTAVYALVRSYELGPDEWTKLPPKHLQALLNLQPQLFAWLPQRLTADDLTTPAGAHALVAVADGEMSLEDTLTATRALL